MLYFSPRSSLRHAFLMVGALLFFNALPVYAAADSAGVLLDRMSHSYRELNYQGSFTFQQGSKLESLRMAHAVIDGKEYERLEYMDGDKREVIRRGHPLNCIHPGHQLMRFYRQKGLQQGALLAASVDQYYLFTVSGEGRIAGRSTVDLQISPRDTHRFGYRLSVDKETGLLLRSELMGPDGKILERFQFVDIRIGEPILLVHFDGVEESYHPQHTAPELNAMPSRTATAGESIEATGKNWTVNWLPGGFTETAINQKLASSDVASFTDGLTVFSVFLEKNIDAVSMATGVEGHAQHGATIAYSRALLLAGHPHRVTVVGEIPPQTAQKIAQSVVFVSP